jgi:PAS domain S-box-containing protein
MFMQKVWPPSRRKREASPLVADEPEHEQFEAELLAFYRYARKGLCFLDADLRLMRVNEAFAEITGFPAKEHLGRGIREVMPELAESVEPACREVLKTGNPKEVIAKHSGALPHDMMVNYYPVRNVSGTVIGISMLVERSNLCAADLEKLVAERTLRLEQTVQSLAGVCYHIAHDLRAPIRAIRGFTELLLESHGFALNAQGKEFVRRIVGACSRMDLLIQDLLAYGRLSHADLPASWINLEDTVEDVIEQYTGEMKKKGAVVQVMRPLPQLWTNSTVLEQSMSNLISNALKYVANGVAPRVQISAEETDSLVRVMIEDNGIGISRAHHDRVFKIFERLHPDSNYPGTGIGLAIVQKGMERMGGRVLLVSDTGMGCKFFLEFPKPNQPLSQ